MSAATISPLGHLAADRACRRWVAATVRDLSAVDGSRALGVGRGVGPFTALLAGRHQHVLAALGALSRPLAVVPCAAGAPTVRVDRRELLEVEPQIDGRFDLVLAIDAIRRLDLDEVVLPHLGCLVAPGGCLLAVDPVGSADWAMVRRRYRTFLPDARIEEVQAEVMGMIWAAMRVITV
jgi:2-polyprenyl-3-methyl-5-hydroxy-6-metoxy-1,4-benzoquinol methylase